MTKPECALRGLAFAALLGLTGLHAAVAATAWSSVPGAGELEVDLNSVQLHRGLVTSWVRHPGRAHPLSPLVPDTGARPPRVYRTSLQTELDCQRRTARVLALQGHDSAGRVVVMSSVDGRPQPLPDGDATARLYDALCELARQSGARAS